MARILSISSQVLRGHVGNSAATFALQRLGHEVWALPTVVLSNHPGHSHVAGTRIAPDILAKMLAALEANGWLDEIDLVMTGYLPSAAHVGVVRNLLLGERRQRKLVVICDPVLGDMPKGLYIEEAAAAAIRDQLLPLADFATPNCFELGWLTGLPVASIAEARSAAEKLGLPKLLVTSVPVTDTTDTEPKTLANLLLTRSSEPGGIHKACTVNVPKLANVPHGTGDLIAALVAGHMFNGQSIEISLARAAAGVAVAISASAGADELSLVASQDAWSSALPLQISELD